MYIEEVEKAEADLEEKELSKKKSGAKQKQSSNTEDHPGSIKKVTLLSYVNLLIKYCAVSCVFCRSFIVKLFLKLMEGRVLDLT